MAIAVTSSGVDVVCRSNAVGPVMWSIDLLCGGKVLGGGAMSVRYDVRVSTGMSF